jgi:hypothetical protein
MSRSKQQIYQDLIQWILPHIRNVQLGGFWLKGRDRSCYFEAELIHNLSLSMFEEEFVDHDFWFLNYQASDYLHSCNSKISPLYDRNKRLIQELIDIIPPEQRKN